MLKNSWRNLLVAGLIALPAVAIPAQSAKTQTQDLVFKLFNNTSKTIVDFRVDPSSQQNWGDSILSEVIPPGAEVDVIIADDRKDCTYDMYTKWSDGAEDTQLNIDMCELGKWTYNE